MTPRSSATVRRIEKLTGSGKLPGPWTITWSKQYFPAVHPLTCNLLWVRCLFDPLQVWSFGANNPWMETFHKFLSKICVSSPIHARIMPNLLKIDRCEVAEPLSGIVWYCSQKPPGVGDTSEPPISPRLSRSRPKFRERWAVHVYRLWSGSAAVCRTYSGKSPKSQYNIGWKLPYAGFQPTNI